MGPQEQLRILAQALKQQGEPDPVARAREALASCLGWTAWEWIENPGTLEERWLTSAQDWNSITARWLEERKAGRPWAQILGGSWFWGRWFHLHEEVLIPRSDSEVLVEAVLEAAERLHALSDSPEQHGGLRLAEVCTGSGALLLTILLEARMRGVAIEAAWGTDLSERALCCAKQNTACLAPEAPLFWRAGDFLSALSGLDPIDLLFVNPPYIAQKEWLDLELQVRDYEPRMALTDGGDGLTFYRRLFCERWRLLRPGGEVWIEMGHLQASAILKLANQAGATCLGLRKDYAGRDRVLGFTDMYNLEVRD